MMGLVKEVRRADASQMQIAYRPIAELKLDPKIPVRTLPGRSAISRAASRPSVSMFRC